MITFSLFLKFQLQVWHLKSLNDLWFSDLSEYHEYVFLYIYVNWRADMFGILPGIKSGSAAFEMLIFFHFFNTFLYSFKIFKNNR